MEQDHAREQAQAQLESILEMVKALHDADDDDESALERIQEDPLEVATRSGWHAPGINDTSEVEYKILLCTGGPAVRIVGELDEHNQPVSARLEYQDWGTPWTEYAPAGDSENLPKLLEYANVFYWGE